MTQMVKFFYEERNTRLQQGESSNPPIGDGDKTPKVNGEDGDKPPKGNGMNGDKPPLTQPFSSPPSSPPSSPSSSST